jgi:hypothetical protein
MYFLNLFITAFSITKLRNTTCYVINKVSEEIVTYSTFVTIDALVCTRFACMRIYFCYWYNCCVAFVSIIRQLSLLHDCSIDWFISVYVVPRELLHCVEVY